MTPPQIFDLFTNNGKRELTRELVLGMLEYNQFEQGEPVQPEQIIQACKEVFIITDIVSCRQCAMLLMEEYTTLRQKQIAALFGMTQSSVNYSIDAFKRKMQEPVWRGLYERVVKKFCPNS